MSVLRNIYVHGGNKEILITASMSKLCLGHRGFTTVILGSLRDLIASF